MKNINISAFGYIFLGISAILWFVIAWATGLDISKFFDLLRLLPTVATIDFILFAVFSKWGWRWKYFQGWLVLFPDLNGTWQGHIQTTWKNPQTEVSPGPIPVILTIKQSFGKISCVMRTAEMTSYSFVEGFKLDEDRQIKQLAYSYTSKPKASVTDRSMPHDGTILLDIIGKPESKLKGQYWTARKTTGEIVLEFREADLLDDLPDDLDTHPVTMTNK
jgi:hypothetical protein